MSKSLGLLGLLLVLGSMTPTTGGSVSVPQSEFVEGCSLCQDHESEMKHRFQSPGARFACNGIDCHPGWAPGSYCDFHSGCGGGGDDEPCDTGCELAVAEASNDGLDAVLAVLDRYAGRVSFNAERGALQTYDCAGLVRAHFPVSDQVMHALKH